MMQRYILVWYLLDFLCVISQCEAYNEYKFDSGNIISGVNISSLYHHLQTKRDLDISDRRAFYRPDLKIPSKVRNRYEDRDSFSAPDDDAQSSENTRNSPNDVFASIASEQSKRKGKARFNVQELERFRFYTDPRDDAAPIEQMTATEKELVRKEKSDSDFKYRIFRGTDHRKKFSSKSDHLEKKVSSQCKKNNPRDKSESYLKRLLSDRDKRQPSANNILNLQSSGLKKERQTGPKQVLNKEKKLKNLKGKINNLDKYLDDPKSVLDFAVGGGQLRAVVKPYEVDPIKSDGSEPSSYKLTPKFANAAGGYLVVPVPQQFADESGQLDDFIGDILTSIRKSVKRAAEYTPALFPPGTGADEVLYKNAPRKQTEGFIPSVNIGQCPKGAYNRVPKSLKARRGSRFPSQTSRSVVHCSKFYDPNWFRPLSMFGGGLKMAIRGNMLGPSNSEQRTAELDRSTLGDEGNSQVAGSKEVRRDVEENRSKENNVDKAKDENAVKKQPNIVRRSETGAKPNGTQFNRMYWPYNRTGTPLTQSPLKLVHPTVLLQPAKLTVNATAKPATQPVYRDYLKNVSSANQRPPTPVNRTALVVPTSRTVWNVTEKTDAKQTDVGHVFKQENLMPTLQYEGAQTPCLCSCRHHTEVPQPNDKESPADVRPIAQLRIKISPHNESRPTEPAHRGVSFPFYRLLPNGDIPKDVLKRILNKTSSSESEGRRRVTAYREGFWRRPRHHGHPKTGRFVKGPNEKGSVDCFDSNREGDQCSRGAPRKSRGLPYFERLLSGTESKNATASSGESTVRGTANGGKDISGAGKETNGKEFMFRKRYNGLSRVDMKKRRRHLKKKKKKKSSLVGRPVDKTCDATTEYAEGAEESTEENAKPPGGAPAAGGGGTPAPGAPATEPSKPAATTSSASPSSVSPSSASPSSASPSSATSKPVETTEAKKPAETTTAAHKAETTTEAHLGGASTVAPGAGIVTEAHAPPAASGGVTRASATEVQHPGQGGGAHEEGAHTTTAPGVGNGGDTMHDAGTSGGGQGGVQSQHEGTTPSGAANGEGVGESEGESFTVSAEDAGKGLGQVLTNNPSSTPMNEILDLSCKLLRPEPTFNPDTMSMVCRQQGKSPARRPRRRLKRKRWARKTHRSRSVDNLSEQEKSSGTEKVISVEITKKEGEGGSDRVEKSFSEEEKDEKMRRHLGYEGIIGCATSRTPAQHEHFFARKNNEPYSYK